MAEHSAEHPGFKAVASRIARRNGYSKARADKILGAAKANASAAARKKNPRLNRTGGGNDHDADD